MSFVKRPEKYGLYDPTFEKENCGVGFVAHIKGRRSHRIVEDASYILSRMDHRGARGAEVNTGDGAGILTAMPHDFLVRVAADIGVSLPAQGAYAAGIVFLPTNGSDRMACKTGVERIIAEHGQSLLGWRPVPVNNTGLGPSALASEPVMEMVFIGSVSMATPEDFDRTLFIIRKQATHLLRSKAYDDDHHFYICSLSSRVIVYKGMLTADQLMTYFPDLNDLDYTTHLAMVHSRFSTNTFPSWDRAQPLRFIAHNGEINTLRGNINKMHSRQDRLKSPLLGKNLYKTFPVTEPDLSDSGTFDNVLELLLVGGRSLPEAMMMMIPEAWENHTSMSSQKKAFYEYHSAMMEPWDGPASITFTDGYYIGAVLDRNGLRPSRMYLTSDDLVIMASEVGVLPIEPDRIIRKTRLQPGKMFLVDFKAGRIIGDEEIKAQVTGARPYAQWLEYGVLRLKNLPPAKAPQPAPADTLRRLQRTFGYTLETINMLLKPMVETSQEALGSMGNDTPLAILSTKSRLIYDYFKQLFAQVTNPPIDSIREDIIMSLESFIGPEHNLLSTEQANCRRLRLNYPVLTNDELASLRHLDFRGWKSRVIDSTFDLKQGGATLTAALNRIQDEAERAIVDGNALVILSDRGVDFDRAPIPALLAVGAVHQHLVRLSKRGQIGLVLESGEPREVHHFCMLSSYGCDAVNPYLAFETLWQLNAEQKFEKAFTARQIEQNYILALAKGMRKVFGKMGISTLESYKSAQIFEAVGLSAEVMNRCFTGTSSRIGGASFAELAQEISVRHDSAWPQHDPNIFDTVRSSGDFHVRSGGEKHMWDPQSIADLQIACRQKDPAAWKRFSDRQNARSTEQATIRGLIRFRSTDADGKPVSPVPLSDVEPATEIVKRFVTGAMSYGSISLEAHQTLAIAMNRLGGKSNTGEGGEDPARYKPLVNGDSMRSAIKQVASGRFGVTIDYLVNSDEIQIKMAQGAKPGEGGELPGHKVDEYIARTRYATPGVGLISPPPHHDIYSIEDLAQLIFDLKNANPRARISVKLVSEIGVGTIAAGVAKGHADHILVSGHDGGTGASPLTGIKNAGLPWELGIAETHQTLVMNDLRSRVILQTDGQLKTGRDVVIAAILGAEECGFSTAPLISLGCVMMRKCHNNSCPVGIATQDKTLRGRFAGRPEYVENFFYFVAEEMRLIMASLGIRTWNELIGRVDLLEQDDSVKTWKSRGVDLSALLVPARKKSPDASVYKTIEQDHGLQTILDRRLIEKCRPAIKDGQHVSFDETISNTDRAVGTLLSHTIAVKNANSGLPEGSVKVNFTGTAGQSFGAWLTSGVTFKLTGDANDYVGKGLCGGRLIISPPDLCAFKPSENIIIGNVAFYGATAGEGYIRGIAAERFCVRNSGARVVVEGVGDHGCEYMTGGRAVILGPTGRNFAAGMSGGIAWVWDPDGRLPAQCNTGMVSLEVPEDTEFVEIHEMISNHHAYTGSDLAFDILGDWENTRKSFVRVIPDDYKQVLSAQKKEIVIRQTGFLEYTRHTAPCRSPGQRIQDCKEFILPLNPAERREQGARCMDCGVPFCQSNYGCPVNNLIPEWNDLIHRGRLEEAFRRLMKTNNFPEVTGRVCPAPCEGACVLGINQPAVTIKDNECYIIDHAWEQGWIKPNPVGFRTSKKVAVIGSGPAGLAAADQLNRAGHEITVYERSDRLGGILMYGIPNMKLDKALLQRRIDIMSAEGVVFKTGTSVGSSDTRYLHSVEPSSVLREFDAVLVASGSTRPRDLQIPGRNLSGIHYAMEYLTGNTKSLLDSKFADGCRINATGKKVIVIGGGDTGNDCIGTALRQGCSSIVNFEVLPRPPADRTADMPWPTFPRTFKADYGHAEASAVFGKDPREYAILTKEFVDNGAGAIKGVRTVRVEWYKNESGQFAMREVAGTEEYFEADLIFLALGFLGPEQSLLEELGVEVDGRANIKADYGRFATNISKVFAAGDARRGQSLVVWAINEGRGAAREIDTFLMGKSWLP